MASEKLTDHILLFEAANFRGSPKQFSELNKKLKKNFKDYGNPQFNKKLIDTFRKVTNNPNQCGYGHVLGNEYYPY
jgi:hypothetical protein